jgi:glycosyltransferase involved in cell wall biosynthesis
MDLHFSFVVPVYNRPEETRELLESLAGQSIRDPFEVVIVEDGSQRTSRSVVEAFQDRLTIAYYQKPNTGPGDSRNFGMQRASGNYIILVDSDCILPPEYLQCVKDSLGRSYLDCFGGPDDAHPSFNAMQQAISFVMTSVLTTGGLRGRKSSKFQPRSFNMGISREAFLSSGGFGNIHPGEDPDLSLRLQKLGYNLGYIPEARVYHKRRINFRSFYRQVYKFGMTRPILNRWHPGSARLVYWFPSFFLVFVLAAVLQPWLWGGPYAWFLPALLGLYLLAAMIGSGIKSGSLRAALLTPAALLVQFAGYGLGFLKSTILLTFSRKKPEVLFPRLFFNP